MPSDFLGEICARKRAELELAKEERDMAAVEAAAGETVPARDFTGALEAEGLSLIAEIKRASPSKGELAPDLVPGELAVRYASAGARALSVLTDLEGFGGSLVDLVEAREACQLPVLRKDFIIDPYQVFEARAAGADAALLIVAALPPEELGDLVEMVAECGMTPLVEVHNAAELEIAVDVGANVIGVNNRDLRTFQVTLAVSLELADLIPSWVVSVSESGIASRQDVEMLASAGFDAILVGESLVVSGNVESAIAGLIGD